MDLSWGFWITISLAVAGIGKFLDEYHINNDTKDKIRKTLITCLNFIEKPNLPNLGIIIILKIFSFLSLLSKKLFLLGVALSLPIIILIFFIWRKTFGPKLLDNYWIYLINWFDTDSIIWILLIIIIMTINILSIRLMLPVLKKMDKEPRLLFHFFVSLKALIYSLIFPFLGLGIMQLPFIKEKMGYANIALLVVMSIFTIPFIFLTIIIIFFILLKCILEIIRFCLKNIFKAASLPDKSPFTYASALIGILVLILKLFEELIK